MDKGIEKKSGISSREKMNRRDFLKVAIAAALATALPKEAAEAAEEVHEFLASSLTQKDIEVAKDKAIENMLHGKQGFWRHKNVREYALQKYFPGAKNEDDVRRMMRRESKMTLVLHDQYDDIQKRCAPQLQELSQAVQIGKYGLFIDGDNQCMYVLQKISASKMQFIKRYPVTTSDKPWSNKTNSGGTPLGLHFVGEKSKGMLGEVVAEANDHLDKLIALPVTMPDEKGHDVTEDAFFVKSLNDPSVGIPEVVTAEYLLLRGKPPKTGPERGVRSHGTNWPALLGRKGSGGCVRQAILDAVDMWQYVTAGSIAKYGEDGGTPVYIHGTVKHPK